MPPKVSVAVITYNQREYLIECIESILAQDYPDVEIVVGDDGSTDGTAEMLREWDRRLPGRFVLRLSPVNQGITRNSNAVLRGCSGDFIAWMGGDDLMLPGKLRKQVQALEENPGAAICYHDLEFFDSETGSHLRYFNSGPGGYRPLQGGPRHLVKHGTFLGACSVMHRASAVPGHGFDERIPISSDWLFWIDIAASGEIIFVDEVLGRYRRHSGNITNRFDDGLEQMLTLDIVESRYPHLRLASRRYRLRYCPGYGVNCLRAGQWRSAGVHLRSILHALSPLPVFRRTPRAADLVPDG